MFTALRGICIDFSSEGSDWMKRTVAGALVALLFLAGLSLLAYPFVANVWNELSGDSYRERDWRRD